ncbi:MAG TPA: 2OG-Fe dioxygenase family protein [Vicinamibacterales bacterium]|nr:2OG-Fe dioxygenase family protein [Vicinamibacterales bacterium]
MPFDALARELHDRGFAFVSGASMRAWLEETGSLDDFAAFGDSWNDLALDTYMADGGRYRRRRHAVFAVASDETVTREPHQPHYQTLEYNPLHGGIARWFEPVAPAFRGGPTLMAILTWCARLFGRIEGRADIPWRVEVHQFRIEARPGQQGRPTPEGMHRDGVDHVLVLLMHRQNIVSGTTTIHGPDHQPLGSFTLTAPLDAALVEDARVFHGVTAVSPLDAEAPAYRDVLVVTFKRAPKV